MAKIRISKIPPGFAPEEIRRSWVGCEIPLVTERDLNEDPPSGSGIGKDNQGGYRVLRDKAISALVSKGEKEAAAYWRNLPLGRYLVFNKEVCELS